MAVNRPMRSEEGLGMAEEAEVGMVPVLRELPGWEWHRSHRRERIPHTFESYNTTSNGVFEGKRKFLFLFLCFGFSNNLMVQKQNNTNPLIMCIFMETILNTI